MAFNKGGGVLAVNSQLCVKDSNIDFATPAGMLFLGSAALTRGNNINFSKFLTDNILGDGILTFPWQGVPSQVTVENSTVYHPEGFGLRNIGSHMAAKSSFMVCAPDESAWVSEPGFGLTDSFDDQGGNKCGCPFANGTCGFPFAGPPSADIPPVGGLE